MNPEFYGTQQDITTFSQNAMPYARGRKRTRSARSRSRTGAITSRSSTRSRSKTSGRQQTWPYQKSGMSPMFDPFPAKIRCMLRYSEAISITASTGLAVHHLFRCNGIFDPNVTGVGHQPYGHDSYAALYNHYNVISSTITVTPAQDLDATIGVTLVDDTSVNSNFDTVKEIKGTKMMVVTNSSPGTGKIQQKYDANQVWDKSYQKSTQASFGADPAEQMYFDIWATGSLLTTSDAVVRLLVTITYEVECFELRDLGQS